MPPAAHTPTAGGSMKLVGFVVVAATVTATVALGLGFRILFLLWGA